MSIEKLIDEEATKFKKQMKTYDKDGGFIVYVEDEDNDGFDTELIENAFTSACTRVAEGVREEIRKEIIGKSESSHCCEDCPCSGYADEILSLPSLTKPV